jgi:hypothetical protein
MKKTVATVHRNFHGEPILCVRALSIVVAGQHLLSGDPPAQHCAMSRTARAAPSQGRSRNERC